MSFQIIYETSNQNRQNNWTKSYLAFEEILVFLQNH
jgi:hypothetical protein